jgi:hypothetical protein
MGVTARGLREPAGARAQALEAMAALDGREWMITIDQFKGVELKVGTGEIG